MYLAKNHPLGRIGIAWQLSEYHGWGIFGLNLALSAASSNPLAIKLLHAHGIDSAKYPQLGHALGEWSDNETGYKYSAGQIRHSDTTVIHSLGNDFTFTSSQHWGKRNIGFIFFENSAFSARGLARAQTLDLLIAGSRWNAELLVKAGLRKVAYVMQGVDMQRFGTVTKNPESNPNRFVIFSGGKLEYRKGQDIVLAAFSAFHRQRPDSVLITAWHNPWPAISQDLANSPYGFGAPKIVNNQIDIAEWCARSGLPASAFLHVGATPNEQMPMVYAQADVALFPNRAEGGTNLVAMEAMAAGVPCILSANTGHLDLIANNNCFPLSNQTPFTNPTHQDWGQSSVDDILQTLEHAYLHRGQLAKTGMMGRTFIEQFTWGNQIRQLINICSDVY
jgi:glycosyltransferase involved in cell wall biosynthesis